MLKYQRKIKFVLNIILSHGREVQRECWQGHILVMCQMSVLKAGSMFILANKRDGKF